MASLPMRLSALLDGSTGAFVEPLRAVYEAAATAIEALGELELIRYDDGAIDDSADLSMWEEMAPLLGSTVTAVNALLAEMEVCFPGSLIPPDVAHARIHHLMQQTAGKLRGDVTSFGMRSRDPSVVGDRWNLIGELQSFRYSTRNLIGNLVFDTASTLGECRRPEVDPGYAEELAHAIAIRTATTELRQTLKARLKAVAAAEAGDLEWNGQQLARELKEFGSGKAWTFLRAQDKRKILEYRQALAQGLADGLTKRALAVIVEPLVDFIAGFKSINQREMLMQHDREVVASCGVAMERVMGILGEGRPDDAVMHFKKVLIFARSVTGRKAQFDAWLKTMSHAQITGNDVATACEQLLEQLSGLELY